MSDVFVAAGAARRRWGMPMLAISVGVLAVTTAVGPATAQATAPSANSHQDRHRRR